MKVIFTKTVNDAQNAGKAFFAGRIYDLDDARVQQLLETVPDAVEVESEEVAIVPVQFSEEPKSKKKSKKRIAPEEEPELAETPAEE